VKDGETTIDVVSHNKYNTITPALAALHSYVTLMHFMMPTLPSSSVICYFCCISVDVYNAFFRLI